MNSFDWIEYKPTFVDNYLPEISVYRRQTAAFSNFWLI
jgi:hypothetical protein